MIVKRNIYHTKAQKDTDSYSHLECLLRISQIASEEILLDWTYICLVYVWIVYKYWWNPPFILFKVSRV